MPNKLLLADDSVTIQRVIELTFADEDIAVTVVGDGRQAIDRLQSDRPDIVLADVRMPERDGYDVAAFVKGNPQLAHIPVILLTGAFEPLDETRARSVGCDGVLVKPFEPQLVIDRVRELLSRRRPAPPSGPGARPDIVESDLDAPLAPPLPVPQAIAPPVQPPAAAAPRKAPDPLEEYFDRLDAAVATIETARNKPRHQDEEPSAMAPEPGQPQSGAPAAAHPVSAGPIAMPDLATAFAALLAAEQGQPAPLATAVLAPAPSIGDDVVEDIVRRVIARLADDAVRNIVADTAERLVREEIDRIKREARSGGSGPQTGR